MSTICLVTCTTLPSTANTSQPLYPLGPLSDQMGDQRNSHDWPQYPAATWPSDVQHESSQPSPNGPTEIGHSLLSYVLLEDNKNKGGGGEGVGLRER